MLMNEHCTLNTINTATILRQTYLEIMNIMIDGINIDIVLIPKWENQNLVTFNVTLKKFTLFQIK